MAMSAPTDNWKKWVGRTVEGKFPLRQWLGGSDHSAVFLTERSGGSQRAAIKLIPAPSPSQGMLDETAQLSRWAGAARLSRPHLIRLFEWGRCQIGDTRLLYVVMEYAEENLAEIIPLRPLTAEEAAQMLRPAAEALDSLHQAGFVHGRIKPSNIMAVGDQLKISADTLRKNGESGEERAPSAWDAPEVATTEPSPAGDIWSLGMTLVAVLTQKEPKVTPGKPGAEAVPETIPQPFREITRKCLQGDPQLRGTASEILGQVPASAPQNQAAAGASVAESHRAKGREKLWIVVGIAVVLFVAVLVGIKFANRPPLVSPAETRPATAHTETPAAQSPAPFSGNQKPAPKGVVRGSVLQQVLPEISRSAQNTITGHIKISVRVDVDKSGNVSEARLVSAGPSKYFANHALEAAHRWKFNPPQVDGQPSASEWILRFQFARTNIQAFPAETKP
jgi:TonB family protein